MEEVVTDVSWNRVLEPVEAGLHDHNDITCVVHGFRLRQGAAERTPLVM